MNHHDADITDVVVVLEDMSDEQTQEAVTRLMSVGLQVGNVDNDNSVVEGSIDATKLSALKGVAGVRYVRSVATYAVDYPPGDPRDLDGPDDESEDDVPN